MRSERSFCGAHDRLFEFIRIRRDITRGVDSWSRRHLCRIDLDISFGVFLEIIGIEEM
jgi:hypothetical protein